MRIRARGRSGDPHSVEELRALEGRDPSLSDVRDMVRAYRLALSDCPAGELFLIGSDQILTVQACLDHLISLPLLSLCLQDHFLH